MSNRYLSPDTESMGLSTVPVSRLEAIADVSGRAFTSKNDPIGNFMFELEPDKEKWQLDFFRSLVTSAPPDSVKQATSPALEAVSIWFGPQNKDEKGGHEDSPEVYQACSRETRQRVAVILETIESLILECAPQEQWYLHLVAVEPSYMGRGLSSKLIIPMLRFTDSQKIPATLVTQHQVNIALYEHLGFRVVKQKGVASSGLHFWFMQHDG